jgi:hypothetical protein
MRRIAPLTGLALLVLGPLAPAAAGTRAAVAILGMTLLFATHLVKPRFRPRAAALSLASDHVKVHAGVLSQRIRAREVTAASTARTARGVALAIVQRESKGRRPLWLELDDDESLERVRRSLHLGHFGFGEMAWPTERPAGSLVLSVFSVILAAGWVTMCFAAAFENAAVCLALALVVLPLSFAIWLGVMASGVQPPQIAVRPHYFSFAGRRGTRFLAYPDLVEARADGDRLRLETRSGAVVVPAQGMTQAERDHVVAQLTSALQRARGQGLPAPDVPASLASLGRRNEATCAWLERVDAAAASFGSGGATYRTAGIDLRDLWSALESPDAPAPVRAAAARVLARVVPDEAGARVGRVLAGERDAATRARIRVALEEDVTTAARELDRLDRGWVRRTPR